MFTARPPASGRPVAIVAVTGPNSGVGAKGIPVDAAAVVTLVTVVVATVPEGALGLGANCDPMSPPTANPAIPVAVAPINALRVTPFFSDSFDNAHLQSVEARSIIFKIIVYTL
jgi:hypothetical protein